ncbi:MAG: ABC transporter ATP-binding protein [Deltaproteobacteria bacterium]|nr:ABC transporter ATP-binding protein [Deltaproteobacteria bacterium]
MIYLAGIERIFQVGDEAVHALSNVNLTLNAGEYIAIMGPSGSGKSTLLNIIGLLDRPDRGVYRLEDVDTTDLTDDQQASVRRHKIGFVFQFFHLVPRLTAAENVELPLILAGVGQRQRVAIARATIMQPNVILADEPTGNLDRNSGKDVIQSLEDLNKKGMTLILVTHDPDLGSRALRKIQMVDGKILENTRAS